MNNKKKITKATLKIDEKKLSLRLDLPTKWLLIIIMSIIIFTRPELWQAIQTALSIFP